MDVTSAVEMREITKRFPGVLANDRIDFSAAWGELHAIIGENGAGKTTLMNVLYGLHRPDRGEIVVSGRPGWRLGAFERLPLLGGILSGHNPLFYLAVVLTVGCSLFLFSTPAGLRIRAAGEHPEAAESLGIRVALVRHFAVTGSGILGGLAGTYLSLGQLNMFAEGMSAGRGFIALAAVTFGKWTPFGAAGAALFFGFFDALQMRLQGREVLGLTVPSEFMLMLPYALAIIALAGIVGRATAPAALGRQED